MAPPNNKRLPTRYLQPLLEQLRGQRVDIEQLLRVAGLDEARFTARDATLLPSEMEAFIASARRLTGRTDLGFEAGRLIQQTMHELLGFGMLSCRNLDEVLRLVVRHYHLMTETFHLRYRRVGGGAGEALYTPATSMPLETLHFYLEMLALAHQNQVRLFLGADLQAFDITLSMPEPAHSARYRALAPVRFHFDPAALPGVRVVMSGELLDRPLALANARVVEDVDERCAALGQRPPASDTGWGDYVTMMLREVQGDLITLDDLARHVRLSARTIDRYLKKEGLQFRDLAQQVRFERACTLLAEPSATVAQVALRLGFSDAANFSRAFRRVFGMAPGEYQKRGASASGA
ncbi:MAG: AraC family transcriptional regulator ligand-binding domain-containing protein [Burkholderiales bacterium]